MGTLQDYLAKNYGGGSAASGGEKKKKKKLKKTTAESSGHLLRIIDEDAGFGAPVETDEQEETRPAFKSDTWTSVSDPRRTSVGESDEGETRGRTRSRSPSASPSPSPNRETHDKSLRKRSRSPSSSPSPSPSRRSQAQARRKSPSRSPSPPKGLRMSDGTQAGLQSSESIRKDLAKISKEKADAISKMDVSLSGRGAATVYRDKAGRVVDPEAERAALAEEEKKKLAEEEARMKWGRGIKQNRDAKALAERLEAEGAAPLAVYADNRQRNEELKERDRWGDPMARLVSSSTKEKKMKSARQVYRGPPPPPNRFGIPPGYRWDGVVRTNGFEAEYFKAKNAKASLKVDAYKWSASDM